MKISAPILLTCLCVVAAGCSREKTDDAKSAKTPQPASYVGSRYDPMPTDVSYEAGTVVIGKDGKPTPFVLSHVRTPRGLMLWLDESLPDDGVIRHRIVRAEMDDPQRAPGERLVIGTCDVKGKLDGGVFALVKEEPGRRYTEIHHAWRAIPEAARFDTIPTTGIVCEEPGGAEIHPNAMRSNPALDSLLNLL